MQKTGFIYHLLPVAQWEKALVEGAYRPESLKKEGFIHCSTWDQVLESANLHLGEWDELVALKLIVRHLKQDLKWEPGRNGENFPHLYGMLPLSSVEDVLFIQKDRDGNFKWEDQ